MVNLEPDNEKYAVEKGSPAGKVALAFKEGKKKRDWFVSSQRQQDNALAISPFR